MKNIPLVFIQIYSTSQRIWIFIFLILNLSSPLCFGEKASVDKDKDKSESSVSRLLYQKDFVKYYSVIPEKQQYEFELGSMWENQSLYWLGASGGFHIGRCMFSLSQSCQQYADIIFGAGGRDGLTTGNLYSALRWQFVDLQRKFVPSVRLLLGVMNIRDEERNKSVFSYGVGYGITTALHERLDLKLEFRAGYAERAWGQILIGFSIKFDKWVNYFAQKLEAMGVAGKVISGAAHFTGETIKKTVETTGKVIQGTVQTTKDITDKAIDVVPGEKDDLEDKKE